MIFYFAPLEGLTDSIFRRIHAAQFGGVDKYFTPFLSPGQHHRFSGREKRELCGSDGLPVTPQLLSNRAEHVLWAAHALLELGCSEVNLNLGCPSGTVTAKKKGAGQLSDLDALARFLDEVTAKSPLPVSVKTRMGMHRPEEFPALLALFCQFPLSELILHPRVGDELYAGTPHEEAFAQALEACPFPVCYNGNLFAAKDVSSLTGRFPRADRLMLGRGAVANPAIFRELRGQGALTKQDLQGFHDRLYAAYREAFSGERPVLCRMKELWSYWGQLFAQGERQRKAIRKAGSLRGYEAAVSEIFGALQLCACPQFAGPGT